jgi:transposase
MKSVLAIEPVYHRTERITAHMHLCVLAYVLTRVVENRTGESWELLREKLERLSLAELETDRATVLKTKRLSASEAGIFKNCGVRPPPRIVAIR